MLLDKCFNDAMKLSKLYLSLRLHSILYISTSMLLNNKAVSTLLSSCEFCQSYKILQSGIWSSKLFVKACLASPWVVGWSGTWDKYMSKWFLNRSKSPQSSFRRWMGRRLKIFAACTAKELSLALFTFAGALSLMGCGTAILPHYIQSSQKMFRRPTTFDWDQSILLLLLFYIFCYIAIVTCWYNFVWNVSNRISVIIITSWG